MLVLLIFGFKGFLGIELLHIIKAQACQPTVVSRPHVPTFREGATAVDANPSIAVPNLHGITALIALCRGVPEDYSCTIHFGEVKSEPHPNGEFSFAVIFERIVRI